MHASASSRARGVARGAAALAVVACRGDAPTRPSTLATPSGGPQLTLTGGAGTRIVPMDEPQNSSPVASFTASCTGTVCTFDASTSTDDVGITSYAWSLGKYPDNEATGVTVTTDFWHTSTRTVTDTKGQTNSVTRIVNIP